MISAHEHGSEATGRRPYFTIAIPAYNRLQLIRRALESCRAQTFTDFEVVVVDDGSTDDTESVVAAFDLPGLTYIRQANGGGAVARNTAADAARGRYLAFLDSDDAFLPGKLAAFHAAIEAADPGLLAETVWYSPLRFLRGEDNALVKPGRAIGPDEPVGDYLFAYEGVMQTSTLVLPKALFDRVRFDPSLRSLQDLDLCLRLEAAGARFRMLPEAQVVWYDVAVDNRISYSTSAEQITTWVERRRSLLSDRAHAGFLARYVAPRVVRAEPIRALGLLGSAVRRGSLTPGRAASILVRGVSPGGYAAARDALVRATTRKAAGKSA